MALSVKRGQQFPRNRLITKARQGLYSSVVERQSCKLKVLGSIPSGGFSGLGRQGDCSYVSEDARYERILEAGLEPAISSLGGRRLIH